MQITFRIDSVTQTNDADGNAVYSVGLLPTKGDLWADTASGFLQVNNINSDGMKFLLDAGVGATLTADVSVDDTQPVGLPIGKLPGPVKLPSPPVLA